MTTGGASVVSPSSKSRPSMSGSASVRKYPGETTLVSRSTVSVTSAVPASIRNARLFPLPSGSVLAQPTASTPSSDGSCSSSCLAVGDSTHGIAESARQLDRYECDACDGRSDVSLERMRQALDEVARREQQDGRERDLRADEQRAQTGTAVLVRDAAGVSAQRGHRRGSRPVKCRRHAEQRAGQARDSDRQQDDARVELRCRAARPAPS